MVNMDRSHHLIVICLAVAAIALATGCGRTGADPYSTQYFEERWLGMGPSQETFRYADSLLKAGRYREAHAAYSAAEKSAYSMELRKAARQRRLYLEDFIRAKQAGRQAPPQPITSAPDHERKPPPKVDLPPPPTGTGSQAGQLQPLAPVATPYGTGSQAGKLQPLLPPLPPPQQPKPYLLPPSPPIVERPVD